MSEKIKIEPWRKCWRNGVDPCLTTDQLLILQKALVDDDPRLLQGATTTPPPLACVADWPCEGACALAYVGAMEMGGLGVTKEEWRQKKSPSISKSTVGAATVQEAEEFFARTCFEVDKRLGEPAGCRWFLNWFDDTPRQEMREKLLGEVERSLLLRATL